MTEDYTIETIDQENTTNPETLDTVERNLQRALAMQRLVRWSSFLSFLFAFGLFIQLQEWQLLASAIGLAIGTAIVFYAVTVLEKGNKDLGDSLFLIAMLIAFGVTEFVIEGFTIFNIGAPVVLIFIYIFFSRPRQIWHSITTFFGFAFIGVSAWLTLWPRITIQNINDIQIEIFPITIVITVIAALLWRLLSGLQKSSITARLVIGFAMAGLVPLVVISLINGGLNFNQNQKGVEENLALIASLTAQNVNHWTQDLETELSNAISTGNVNDYNKFLVDRATLTNPDEFYLELKLLLDDIQARNNNINELSLTDVNGRVIISTNENLEGTNVAEEIYFVEGVSSAEFYIDMPKFEPLFDEIVITAAYPLTQTSALSFSGAKVVGMLTAQLNVDELFGFFSEVNSLTGSTTTETYLVNSAKILVSPSRHVGYDIGNTVVDNPAISTAINNKSSGQGQYPSYHNNINVFGVFYWIPELQSVLITEQSQQEAFAPLRQNVIVNIIITLIGGITAVILGWINTQNISQPIRLLTNTMKSLTQGNLSQRVAIERADEIGQLSDSMNEMSAQLQDSIENLEGTVSSRTLELEKRAQYLEAAAEVGQAAAQFYSLDDLLIPVTHLISERFNFYHVGIFLVDDEKEFAVLRAANSEGGWRMLARGHRLRVAEEGIVGNVTSTRQPKVLQQVGSDEIYFDNPDLPLTRSEMALPLEASGELLGALDVQSTEENAFSPEDVSVLQVLANQVALAIYNAKLFDQLQSSLESERRIFGELSQEAWVDLLRGRTGLDIQATENSLNIVNSTLNSESRQAINEKKTIQTARGSDAGYSLSIPIKVHGNVVIGVIETNKSPNAGPWLIQEIAVMEAIGEQLGIALENARLFDETQRLAFRERIAADVAGKVWASSDIETILQTTVEELSRALNASHGTIRLSFTETTEEGTSG